MRSLSTTSDTTDVKRLLDRHKRGDVWLFVIIFVTTLGLIPMLTVAGLNVGFGVVIGVSLALLVAFLVVRWPIVGLLLVMACAVVIEESPLIGIPSDFTDQLYIFSWPDALQGLPDRPIGFLLLLILAVVVISRLTKRVRPLEGGPIIIPFGMFMLCVVFGIVHGLATGGQLKIIVIEFRPLWYLFVTYLLAYNLFTNIQQIRALFWIVILGAGFKGFQGLYIIYVVLKGSLAGRDELIAHEDSFFFAAVILLIVLFCIQHRYRAQLIAALLVLPPVIITMVANQRRADYIALLLGMGFAGTLIYLIKPEKRRMLIKVAICVVIIGGGYIAIFSRTQGLLGSPARSVIAVFHPTDTDIRDIQSNLYRIVENHDLLYTESQNPILGLGFGKAFSTPWPLIDISQDDQYYLYIPHNTIYWIFADLGPIGFMALWYLFGSIIIRGCMIVRNLKSSYLQMVGIYVVAVTVMEIVVSFADYQLFFYRPVIYIGLFVGLLMKLPVIEQNENRMAPLSLEEQAVQLAESEEREMQVLV